ncbi:MAG: rRNA pseudouridine synthase [Clostridiaceae bacterium]|jgi:pseudouridine synthase|nr:rRNA pseudouridine synthase [Clostridiaceae bacterium]
MRINKFLAECGVASRRGAEQIISDGRVKVNRVTVTELATEINPDNDTVTVDGRKISLPSSYTYIMFNKPKGCVTTASDEKGRTTVFDYIDIDKRLFTVGRLDYDSEGLLIFTNDGQLAQKLTHPSNEIPKTYIVKVEGEIKESELAVLRKGVKLEDGTKLSHSKVKLTAFKENISRLEVIIFEGKNREIRRMFEAVNKNVTFLKRVAVGDLRLGGLSRGKHRDLNPAEIEYLLSL